MIPDLERIRAYCEKATKGPWSWDFCDKQVPTYHHILAVGGNNPDCGKGVADTYSASECHIGQEIIPARHGRKEDADFIAASRQDLPACVEEIERLRKVIEDARNELADNEICEANPNRCERCAVPCSPGRTFLSLAQALAPKENA